MRSSTFIPRTYPSLSREAILKIRPALCPNPDFKTQRQGPGSGSLGEFIEKLTPSVVLSCLANKVKKKRHLLESFLIFSLVRRFGLLFLSGCEQHISRRDTAPPAIFRV